MPPRLMHQDTTSDGRSSGEVSSRCRSHARSPGWRRVDRGPGQLPPRVAGAATQPVEERVTTSGPPRRQKWSPTSRAADGQSHQHHVHVLVLGLVDQLVGWQGLAHLHSPYCMLAGEKYPIRKWIRCAR